MKTIRKNAIIFIMSVFEIAVGVLLLIDPVGFTHGIITALGIGLIVIGAICAIKYFKTDICEAALSQNLLKGMLAVGAGIFFVVQAAWFSQAIQLLTTVYGIGILFVSLIKIQWSVNALRFKNAKWFIPSISAAVSVICAVVTMLNPFATQNVLWGFTGALLILSAFADLVSLFVLDSNEKTEDEKQEETD